jgi:hypothetical protein
MRTLRWFKDVKSYEEGRALFKRLVLENHPDQKPEAEKPQAEELTKSILSEWTYFVDKVADTLMAAAATHQHQSNMGWTASRRQDLKQQYADILSALGEMNVEVEIIGDWIFVRKCLLPRWLMKLTFLGFWFSKTHNAMIFSGGDKQRKAPVFKTTEAMRQRFGSEMLKTQMVLEEEEL